jgi:hypothetical protein
MSVPLLKIIEDTAVEVSNIDNVEEAFRSTQKTAQSRIDYCAALTKHLVAAGFGRVEEAPSTSHVKKSIDADYQIPVSQILESTLALQRMRLGLVRMLHLLQCMKCAGGFQLYPADNPDNRRIGFEGAMDIWVPAQRGDSFAI